MSERKNIAILGGGESGVGAALLAKAKGYAVFLSDRGEIKDNYRAELEAAGIAYEAGQHTVDKIQQAQTVIKSPGIPDRVPLVRRLVDKGIPVISEIEWAARFTTATLIGITGSNGKTTTATLTHHLMQAAGLDAELAGNVGISFARRVLAAQQPTYYVLELSSFQLDGIVDFRPRLAALLNITPDHLDRYEYELDKYRDSKFRIVRNQTVGDTFFYFAGDDTVLAGLAAHTIEVQKVALTDTAFHAGEIVTRSGRRFTLTTTQLRGTHNARNALFALEIALAAGADPDRLQAGLDSYRPQAHRLEPVGSHAGVAYINDSKATNVDAVYYALGAMDAPIVWIAGGTDKGNEYEILYPLVKQKVKALVCLGVDNSKLLRAFDSRIDTIVETRSMAAAVQAARQLADPGDTVLLAPACASFDLFDNYMDRGDQFRNAVRQVKG